MEIVAAIITLVVGVLNGVSIGAISIPLRIVLKTPCTSGRTLYSCSSGLLTKSSNPFLSH